nr:PepSY-like domain-containing protein [uncultured Emticicia sp.]
MKRTQVLAVIAVSIFSTGAFAQKINSDKVPAAVKQAFNKAYPTAKDTKWDKEGNDFEASFEQGKEELSVVFDGKGNVLEVEKEIEFSALPAPVQAALKGKKVKETAIITKGGKTFYEAEVGGKDLMFDAQGKASN